MKKLSIILFLALAIVVPVTADTGLPFSFTKPLCSFHFGSNAGAIGGFLVQYDGRFFDTSYAGQTSRPNGGIKFAVEIGYYKTSGERDTEANKVINITFVNTTKGSTHILTKAGKFIFTDRFKNVSHVADYSLWFGEAQNAIGDWKIYMVHKDGIYSANFSIAQEMIDSLAPIPVELDIIKNDDGSFALQFYPTLSTTEYRVRIYNGIDFIFDTQILQPASISDPITVQLPLTVTNIGKSGRVEARLTSGHWIGLLPCSSKTGPNQFVYTKDSRACTYFNLK
jgi:hypothetical protein